MPKGILVAACGQMREPAFDSPIRQSILMSDVRPEKETRRLPNGSRKDLESSNNPIRASERRSGQARLRRRRRAESNGDGSNGSNGKSWGKAWRGEADLCRRAR